MALANYSDLTTAVATWLGRSGDTTISNNAADLVAICQARLNRLLSLREFKDTTSLTGTADSRVISLPNDFVQAYSLHLTTGTDYKPLTARTPAGLAYDETSAEPTEWAIRGTRIVFNCPLDEAHTFDLYYRQKLALSASSTTNWLLTNHPDVYLYGSLLAAHVLTLNPQKAAPMKALFDEAIAELGNVESASQGIAEAQFDPGLTMGRRYVSDLTTA